MSNQAIKTKPDTVTQTEHDRKAYSPSKIIDDLIQDSRAPSASYEVESEVNKASQAYKITIATDFSGTIRINGHMLEGWVSSAAGISIVRNLVLTIAGDSRVRNLTRVNRPSSPYLEIGEQDIVYFETDLSCYLSNKDLEDYIEASVRINKATHASPEAGSAIITSTFSRKENIPLNKNSLFIPMNSISIQDWDILHNERVGLRIDSFKLCDQELEECKFDPNVVSGMSVPKNKSSHSGTIEDAPSRYSRIAFTEKIASNSRIVLSTKLDVSAKLETKDLQLAAFMRADRTTNISARLTRNGQVISNVEITAETHWCDFRRLMKGSLSKPRHKTAVYRLELEINHSGRGFVDIVACSVATNPSLRFICNPDYINEVATEIKLKKNCNYVRNGDFNHWSNGFVFDNLEARQETADGWRVECRKREAQHAKISLCQLSLDELLSRENSTPQYGLRVCTENFTGTMRLTSSVDRHFQNCQSVRFSMDVQIPNVDFPVKAFKKMYLVGRGVDGEEILHIIARRPTVAKAKTLSYEISEKDLVKLRLSSSKYSSLLLAIELEQDTTVIFSKVGIYSEGYQSDHIARSDIGSSPVSKLCFEDSNIEQQATFLKGLESWNSSTVQTVKSCEIGAKTTTYEGSIKDIKRPKIVRPYRGYPSVDIVVPIHNATDAVKQCLRSIIEETTVPYSVICIDDASNIETRSWLQDFTNEWQQVNLYINEENLGYTKSVNRGIGESTADWVCVLNSDCVVTTNWLERLIDVAMDDANIGIVSPLSNAASYQSVPRIYVNDDEKKGWSFNPLPAGVTPNDMADLIWKHTMSARPQVGVSNGFCQLVRRAMLDEIGILDEVNFPRGFGEENDLCVRVVKAGWQIRIADDTYVFHMKSMSFGHEQRKKLSKEGSISLKKKHPDIDWNEIVSSFKNIDELVELRKSISKSGF